MFIKKEIQNLFDYLILGSKKERRLRKLENENKLARDLIKSLKHDMLVIRDSLENDYGVSMTIGDPYYRLSHDIGRCDGYLEENNNT